MHPRNTKKQMCKILILGATSIVANGFKVGSINSKIRV